VYGVDKCTYVANTSLLKSFEANPNFTFIKEDIKDLQHLYDCDYVINTAAESHVGNSIIDSQEFIDSNIVGVRNLLDLIRNKPVNCNRRPVFFHFSTDEVYGDIESGEHTEQDILHPSNPYSAAKACSDMLILAWARTYGVEYILLRPTNNYGIGQYPEKLIPLSVKNLMRNRKIRLHNAGTPVRNWLHADDTAEAVMTIIDSGNTNEIYNVAGGFEQKNIDTILKVIDNFFEEDYNWEEHVDFSYSREGQDVRYALNDDKLRALGWTAKRDFNKEIYDIVQYYKKNFIW
jgi:dTDP-glucose 4,6-dehydratase